MREEMRKYEYTLDVFKGTCELNNFEQVGVVLGDYSIQDVMKKFPKKERMYFYSNTIEDGNEKTVFAAIRKSKTPYDVYEMINMAVKFLSNLGIEEAMVGVSGVDSETIISALDGIDIPVYEDEKLDKKVPSFAVYVDDEKLVSGVLDEDGYIYFTVGYERIEPEILYKDKAEGLDVYISTTDEYLLDDAFIIGTDLRDAGFKVEVDYTLKQVTKEDIDATFLITFDKKDIEKYQVKLVDMATKEIKTVMIDNLVEELAFI